MIPRLSSADVAGKIAAADLAKFLSGRGANEIWELWLASSKTSSVIDQCIATTEPAYLAKHVFQLGQLFNTFYHSPSRSSAKPDEKRKQFLLATVAVVRRELIRCLAVMGITAAAGHVEYVPLRRGRSCRVSLFTHATMLRPYPRRLIRGFAASSSALLVLVLALAVVGMIYENISEARDRRFNPDGRPALRRRRIQDAH